MTFQERSGAIFNGVLNVLAWVAAVIILFIMLSVGSDVVMRYFFKQPQIWVLEVTEYALLFMTFLSATWLLRDEGHVKMDLILSLLKPRVRKILNTFTTILLAILFIILTWYGTKVTWEQFQNDYFMATPLEVPTGPLMCVIPIGFFLLFIQTLRMLHGYLRKSGPETSSKD